MSLFPRMSFAAKIGLGSMGIVLVVTVMTSFLVSRMGADALVGESKKRGVVLAGSLAARAVEPILAGDLLRLKNMVDEMRWVGEDVVYAFVLDARGRVLAHTFQGGFPTDLLTVHPVPADSGHSIRLLSDRSAGGRRIDDVATPVTLAGERLGTARLGLSRHKVQEEVRGLVLGITALGAGALVLAVFMSSLFAREVSRRLGVLQRHAEEIVKGNLDLATAPPKERHCWQVMDCHLDHCPAHGEKDLRCWYVAGDICPHCQNNGDADTEGEGIEAGAFASCLECPVYQDAGGDEIQELAEAFDVMTRTLKAHIAELTEARERLTAQQEQLIHAQKMEALGKLAGGVAHEINTPLGVILGYAQLLQEDAPEGSQVREDLGTIERQAKVCRKIVADLLGYSRRSQSEKREMCFNNSVMEAVTLVAHTFGLDNVDIVTRLDDRMPIIYGDPEKLKQVWINLLTNARDAMAKDFGGGRILVQTRLDAAESLVRLWVADTGQGIRENVLPKVFDPFFSTKAVGEGTGLGLSVSFGIIEDHDGTIRAESPTPADLRPQRPQGPEAPDYQEGPGAVFRVDLPLDHSVDQPPERTGSKSAAQLCAPDPNDHQGGDNG